MTHEDIPLPGGVRRIVDLLWETVLSGRQALLQRFGAPAYAWRSNADAAPDLPYALVKLRRLHRILRYIFVILAVRVAVTLTPQRARKMPRPPPAARVVLAHDPATWRMSFSVSTRWPRFIERDSGPRPPHLAAGVRPSLLTLARKLEGLRRALADPMRHVHRLARLLATTILIVKRRPAKRTPRRDRRDFLDDLETAREQAAWEVRQLKPG